jgi:tRNA-Thr(GGU) m(6)t(6)A37 methyltransferase TsaA
VNGAPGENELLPIGRVESPLGDRAAAPKQGDEGAPEAVLVFAERVRAGLVGLAAGDEALLLTWLHRADREALTVHPRGDVARPAQGVFGTRSPDRPNPIGLHRIEILDVDGARLRVAGLEAIDGTPILDLKPVLARSPEER